MTRNAMVYIFSILFLTNSAFADHHGNADAKISGPYSKSALIKIAMSAGPPSVSAHATITDYDGTLIRQGTNAWVCTTGGDPQRINPSCLDEEWRKWNDRFMAGEPNDIKNQRFGQAYMLQGDVPVDNDKPDSYAMDDHEKSPATGHFHDSGPHIMLLLPREVLQQITSDPYASGSYVMFPNTEWEHLMIPVGDVVPSFNE
ncbi:MAG: hypothetical protein VYE04_18930 [Pseudomonadota bacterium]|nr:hypothetical protein [Pseudomonadota bacterium]